MQTNFTADASSTNVRFRVTPSRDDSERNLWIVKVLAYLGAGLFGIAFWYLIISLAM